MIQTESLRQNLWTGLAYPWRDGLGFRWGRWWRYDERDSQFQAVRGTIEALM